MPSKLSMAPPKSAILRLHCCTRIFIEYGQQHQKNTPFYVYIYVSISIFEFFGFLDKTHSPFWGHTFKHDFLVVVVVVAAVAFPALLFLGTD